MQWVWVASWAKVGSQMHAWVVHEEWGSENSMHKFMYTGVIALLIVVIDGACKSGMYLPCTFLIWQYGWCAIWQQGVSVCDSVSNPLLHNMSFLEGNVVVIGSGWEGLAAAAASIAPLNPSFDGLTALVTMSMSACSSLCLLLCILIRDAPVRFWTVVRTWTF